jgi:iron(III) transport system permease protein
MLRGISTWQGEKKPKRVRLMSGGLTDRLTAPINGRLRRLFGGGDDPVALWVLMLPVILVSIFALAPIVIAIVSSFRISLPGQEAVWGFQGWIDAFTSAAIWESIYSTFVLAFLRVPFAVALGAVLAWLLIRTDIPGRRAIEFCFWIAFFLPSLPMAMAWGLLLDPQAGWINLALQHYLGLTEPLFNIFTYLGITWVHLTASTVPVMIILMGPAFRALDPAMEESARMSGASNFQCFRRVVFPLVSPAIITAGIASLIRSLEAFEIELFLGVPANIRVYSTKIHELAVYDPPQYAASMALSVPFVSLLFLLAMFYQRYLMKRRSSFATVTGKSSNLHSIDLGKWRLPATILCVLLVVLAVIVPTVTLVLGSFMDLFGMAGPDGSGFGFTARHWVEVIEDSLFLDSVINTLKLGFGAAACGILAYSVLAYLIVRSNVPGRQFMDIVVWLPWAIPGILLSLALLWMYLGTPFLTVLYGSMLGLILAMVFKDMPIGVNLMKSGILQIGPELEEAAKVAGASWWQIYWRLYFPLLAPTAIAVGMLVFIACVKDISTMVLLSTSETRPLSILLLDYATEEEVERGAVVGVISTALTIVVAFAGRRIGLNFGR